MTEVYIITSGEYSDYSINAVYTDKEVADKLAEAGFRVETWQADEGIDRVKLGFMPYNALGWLDEDEIDIQEMFPMENIRNDAIISEVKDWHNRIGMQDPPLRTRFQTWFWAKGRDEAMKIAAERKAKLSYLYYESGVPQMDF